MQPIKDFLFSGSPAHWQLFAVLAYMILEFALGKSKSVQANSVIELALSLLKKLPLVASASKGDGQKPDA